MTAIMKLKPLLLAAAVGALVCLAAGCGSSGTTTAGAAGLSATHSNIYTPATPGGTPVRGGTAVIDRGEAPESFDPVNAGPPGETVIDLAIFDQLAETFPGADKEPQPGLAESWSVAHGGLSVVFHVRHGVEFSNGEPLTGEDVVYSLKRLEEPEAVSHYVSTLWKQVVLTGPMTVEVQLKKPSPGLVGDLSQSNTSIMPKKVLQKEGEKAFALHPVGTGPFVVTGTTPGNTTVTMSRNPHYWRHDEPYLDRLVWNQVPEANSRVLAVRSGEATVATGTPFSQAASLKKTPGVRLLVRPFSGSAWEIVNNGVAPLNEVNVRRALAYATPREAIIKSVYGGLAEPSNNAFGKELQDWDSSVPTFPYDVAKAKELLRHSSVPNGFDVTIVIPTGEPEVALTASIEQSAWAQIGVHVKIEALQPSSAINKWFDLQYQIVMPPPEFSVIENPGPDQAALECEDYVDSGIHACESNYNSPKAIALIRRATTSQSESVRRKLFGDIQRLVNFEEAGYLSVAFVPTLTLVRSSLHGFDNPPTGYFRMERAWLQR
jgi:peptide/nickel transport system substrate-binding protein